MKTYVAAAIAIVVAVVSPAAARDTLRRPGTSIDVIMDGHEPSRVFYRQNAPRVEMVGGAAYNFAYVHAILGQKYSIRVQQSSPNRQLVCVAIDGRSVIDGEKIETPHRRTSWGKCHVVSQTVTIGGWRTSSQSVRRFVFTDESRSVANTQWNDISAVGTMVVAVFREREQPLSDREATPEVQSRSLGTDAGESVHSPVTRVEFESQPVASAVAVMRYASRQALVDAGLWPKCQDSSDFKRFGPSTCSEEGYIKFK